MNGVSEEAMANIVPEIWRDKVSRAGEQDASGPPVEEAMVNIVPEIWRDRV